MDAKQLHELVKDWPREAWPEGLTWLLPDGQYPIATIETIGTGDVVYRYRGIMPQHATLLFEASGMRWYIEQQRGAMKAAYVALRDDGWWSVRYGEDSDADGSGDTIIEAISAAVLAMAERSKR